MKLIIAGSRGIYIDYEEMENFLPDDWTDLEIVSGAAQGPDTIAINMAKVNELPIHIFPAEWEKFGKKAGILRNIEMGNFADGLLAFWDGESRGTKHMIDYMTSLGKPVKVIKIGKAKV